MVKIRIGNDIKVRLELFRGFSDNKIPANIQSIKAYIINTTVADEKISEWNKKTRFIGRFPHEPFLDEYLPTQFNINCSGHHRYHAAVANRYAGFGIYPDWQKHLIHKEPNDYKYLAPVAHTASRNVVVATFPASQQHHIGVYKVVLVVKCYESGYNNNNIRTYTTDYPEAFELVATTEEADPDQTQIVNLISGINGDPADDPNAALDIYTSSGQYSRSSDENDSTVKHDTLTMKLTNGGTYSIDLDNYTDEISGWYEED